MLIILRKENIVQKHKWHKEIVAWASGAEIELRYGNTWIDCKTPQWGVQTEYRIKPQPKEPQYLYVFSHSASIGVHFKQHNGLNPNETYIGKIKLEVDDE